MNRETNDLVGSQGGEGGIKRMKKEGEKEKAKVKARKEKKM